MPKPSSLQDIARAGVGKIFGEDSEFLEEFKNPEEHNSEQEQPEPQVAAKVEDPVPQPLPANSLPIEFSAEGEAINLGKRTLNRVGFAEHNFVVRKEPKRDESKSDKTKRSVQEQWKIEKINSDGSTVLRILMKDGNLEPGPERNWKTVNSQDMIDGYKVVTRSITIEKRIPWNCTEIQSDLKTCIAFTTMYGKYKKFDDRGKCRIQLTPTKVLFSEKAFRTGDEVCMPMTTWNGFKAVNPEKKDAYSQTFAITLTTPDKKVTRYSMTQPKCGSGHIALAWQIPTTGRKEEANLKIRQVTETAACLRIV